MAPKDVKRRADFDQSTQNSSSHKKPKEGSIMDYMTRKPQPRPKPSALEKDVAQGGKSEMTKEEYLARASSSEAMASESELAKGEEASSDCGTTSKYFSSKNNPPQKPDTNQDELQTVTSSNTLQLPESIGDIFDAPHGTLIIHACNCQGSWGAGIAAAFRKHYPGAYNLYAARCRKWGNQLFEGAQLIPPQKLDRKGHFVGCLYTSRYYGKRKDDPDTILSVTAPAMQDLLEKVQEWNDEHEESERVKEVRMCMINSGLFNVKWGKTRAVLEGIDVSGFDVKEVKIISREE